MAAALTSSTDSDNKEIRTETNNKLRSSEHRRGNEPIQARNKMEQLFIPGARLSG